MTAVTLRRSGIVDHIRGHPTLGLGGDKKERGVRPELVDISYRAFFRSLFRSCFKSALSVPRTRATSTLFCQMIRLFLMLCPVPTVLIALRRFTMFRFS